MNIETLKARKDSLKLQFDQAVSNANALQGAIQNVDWMIAEIEKEEVAKNSKTE